ncbi:hypothetical protein PN836_017590 [Ningiella sp. W23]|uniref:hypothetical protein n=1 Tax=Ningiella sp. W23 TaxID=3023715 RepID=UPI0037574907
MSLNKKAGGFAPTGSTSPTNTRHVIANKSLAKNSNTNHSLEARLEAMLAVLESAINNTEFWFEKRSFWIAFHGIKHLGFCAGDLGMIFTWAYDCGVKLEYDFNGSDEIYLRIDTKHSPASEALSKFAPLQRAKGLAHVLCFLLGREQNSSNAEVKEVFKTYEAEDPDLFGAQALPVESIQTPALLRIALSREWQMLRPVARRGLMEAESCA